MNNKFQPALIGGVILGLLSALPFIGVVNACCCAWAIVGGLVAANLAVKRSTTPITLGEGALLGVIAGVVGSIIYVLLGIPLNVLTGNATLALMQGFISNLNPEAARAIQQQQAMMQGQSIISQIVAAIPGALIGSVFLTIFATIGGVLGTALFEKRKGTPNVPPPPPNFGGTPPPPASGFGNQPGGYGTGQPGGFGG